MRETARLSPPQLFASLFARTRPSALLLRPLAVAMPPALKPFPIFARCDNHDALL